LIGKERHGFYQQISEATSEEELAVVLWENGTVFCKEETGIISNKHYGIIFNKKFKFN